MIDYRINAERKWVEVQDAEGFWSGKLMYFSQLAASSGLQILNGETVRDQRSKHNPPVKWSDIEPERRQVYAVARDELLELGLIEDEST